MSDCERFAQIAQDKWVTVSESLRSLRGNERMSNLLKKIWLRKSKILFFVCFIYDLKKNYWKISELLIFAHFLFFGEQYEWFAHDCSFPLSDVSESLRLLTKNERCEQITQVAHQKWAIHSHRSEEMSDRERIAQVTHQKWANEWIAHFFERIAHSLIFGLKTSDLLGKPMSEFPALVKGGKGW